MPATRTVSATRVRRQRDEGLIEPPQVIAETPQPADTLQLPGVGRTWCTFRLLHATLMQAVHMIECRDRGIETHPGPTVVTAQTDLIDKRLKRLDIMSDRCTLRTVGRNTTQ